MATPSQLFTTGQSGDSRLFYQNPQGQYTQIANPTELQNLAKQGVVQSGGQRGILPTGALNPTPQAPTAQNTTNSTQPATPGTATPSESVTGKLESSPGVFKSSSLVDYYQNEIGRQRESYNKASSSLADINNQLGKLYSSPSLSSQYNTQLSQATSTVDSSITQGTQELNKVNQALAGIEQEVRSRLGGGQAPESYIQAQIARDAEPLIRQKQALQENISNLQNQRSSIVAGVERGLGFAQADRENQFNVLNFQKGLAESTINSFGTLIEKGAAATQMERDRATELFSTFLEKSPDFLHQLSKEEVTQLEQGVMPFSALQKLGDTIKEKQIAEQAASKADNKKLVGDAKNGFFEYDPYNGTLTAIGANGRPVANSPISQQRPQSSGGQTRSPAVPTISGNGASMSGNDELVPFFLPGMLTPMMLKPSVIAENFGPLAANSAVVQQRATEQRIDINKFDPIVQNLISGAFTMSDITATDKKRLATQIAQAEKAGLLSTKGAPKASTSSSQSNQQTTQKPLSGDASKLLSITDSIIPEIDRLIAAYEKDYKGTLIGITSGTNPELSKLTSNVSDKLGRLRSGGAINKDEEARFRKQIASPSDLFVGNKDAALSALRGIRNEAVNVSNNLRGTTSTSAATDINYLRSKYNY